MSFSEISIRAAISSDCGHCSKKCRYRTLEVTPTTPEPTFLLLQASPWECVIKQSTIGEKSILIFYRCEDPTCLLVHLRQAVALGWANEWQRQQQQKMVVQQAARKKPAKKGRRSNRRNRSKRA